MRGRHWLVVHRGYCAATDWGNILPKLSEQYRCIVPDGVSCEINPWMVWVLLDSLGIKRAGLVGHSQGGRVICDMYRLQPQRVWAYVNIDCEAIGAKIRSFTLPLEQLDPANRREYERRKAELPSGPSYFWEPYVTRVPPSYTPRTCGGGRHGMQATVG